MSQNVNNDTANPQVPLWRQMGRWARNHASTLVVLGMVMFVGLMQWPMLKGVVANAVGAPIPADHIAWRSDYNAALKESQQTGKPVLLDFTASWCPPCQMMKREVWPDKEVEAQVNGSFIPVAIDVDEPGNARLAEQYEVTGIPDVIVVDSSGKVLKRAHYLSKSEMLRFLSKSLAGQGA